MKYKYSTEYKACLPSPKYSKCSIALRNVLYMRGTTSLSSAESYVVGDWGSMSRKGMRKQSLSVSICDIRVPPMMVAIEELQFHR